MTDLDIYSILNLSTAVVFDTETSGLDSKAEICEISIIDITERVLFTNTLRTKTRMSEEVIKIHGITNEISIRSHQIDYYWKFLSGNLLADKPVLGYNVFFDIRMLFQSMSVWDPTECLYFNATAVFDVMQYAKKILRESKWLSLKAACEKAEVDLTGMEGKFHGSLYDSVATLRLFKKLVSMKEF